MRNIEKILILNTRTDVGQNIDSTYSDDKAHISPRIRTFTVRTIEKIIRLSTRTSVDKIIDSTYSDEKTQISLRI